MFTRESNYASATQEITKAKILLDYDVWCSVRYFGRKTVSRYLASFSDINSLLSDEVVTKTSIWFTPILPHPITDFESVYTVMRSFQDVLKQKETKLWTALVRWRGLPVGHRNPTPLSWWKGRSYDFSPVLWTSKERKVIWFQSCLLNPETEGHMISAMSLLSLY